LGKNPFSWGKFFSFVILAFTFKQFRNNVNAHEKFVQLKALVKRLHRSLSILYTPTKRIFLPLRTEMGHFWIRESHFAPKKASWRQNDVRPNYVQPCFARAISFLNSKDFPTQQRIAC